MTESLHDQLVAKVESMKDVLEAKQKEIEFPPSEKVVLTPEIMANINREMERMYQCPVCHEQLPRGKYREICYTCQQKRDANTKEEWLNQQAQLPIEERLRLIESWMYDHQRAKHISPFDMVMR